MKKILSIALCAAAVSAFADTETETELGLVGVTEITSSLQNTIVAVSYDDLAGGSGMVVSNLVKTTNLTAGDQLAIFNNGTGDEIYDTWVLKDEGGVKYWAKNDKTFYIDANGQLDEGEGKPASIVTKAVGTGIWLCRATKPTASFTFYIYGKPVSDSISTTVAGSWTLIGNPTQKTVTIGADTVSGVQTEDQIVTADQDGKLHYYTFIGSNWTNPIEIGPGIGFWIKTQSKTTITWPTSKEQ